MGKGEENLNLPKKHPLSLSNDRILLLFCVLVSLSGHTFIFYFQLSEYKKLNFEFYKMLYSLNIAYLMCDYLSFTVCSESAMVITSMLYRLGVLFASFRWYFVFSQTWGSSFLTSFSSSSITTLSWNLSKYIKINLGKV